MSLIVLFFQSLSNGTLGATIDAITTSATTGTVGVSGSVAADIGAIGVETTANRTVGTSTAYGRQAYGLYVPLGTSAAVTANSAAGEVIVSGALADTIDDLTLVATGTVPVAASLSETIDAITISASVADPVAAATDATVGPITSTATATVEVSGSCAASIDPLSLAANAAVIAAATLDATLDSVIPTIADHETVAAELAAALSAITVGSTSEVLVSATADFDAGPIVAEIVAAAAIGPVIPPFIRGGGGIAQRRYRRPIAGTVTALIPPFGLAATASAQHRHRPARRKRMGRAIAGRVPGEIGAIGATAVGRCRLSGMMQSQFAPVTGAVAVKQYTPEDELLVLLLAA